jgi:hypothetical protein
MGIYDSELIELRGYRAKDDDVYIVNKVGADDYLGFDYIRSLIIEMTTTLSNTLYRTADIASYVTTLQNATFGPTIRKAIYDIFKELARVSGIYIGRELASIRLAHFGKDMRQPLYDALVKLGIEQDLYYDAVSSDFIYSINGGYATLDYYIGEDQPYIRIPATVDDLSNPGYTAEVKTLSTTLFTNATWLKGVSVPHGVTQIM